MGLKSTSVASFPPADGPPYPLDGLTRYHVPLCVARTEKVGKGVAAVKGTGLP